MNEFLQEKKTLLRGLVHPTAFYSNNEMATAIATFGGVEVSPMSIYQLMQEKQNILLYPGGARL